MPKQSLTTQHLVNAFPGWAAVRQDEQSLGFQFLNTIAGQLDDLRKQLRRVGENYYLPTAITSDIDLYYYLPLPGDFEFTKVDEDETEFIFTPPTVSGTIGDGTYDVQIAENNDIEHFWYDVIPDRISLETSLTGELVLASGYAYESPFDILVPSGIMPVTNHVTIEVSGGTKYFELSDDGFTSRCLVQIDGLTRAGLTVTEEIPFFYDDVQKTFHEFQRITGARIYGVQDATEAFVLITSAMFNKNDYPIEFNELPRTKNRETMPLFWAVGSGETTGVRTLDIVKYDADDIALRLEGFVDKSPIMQIELLDENENNIYPSDLATEPYSDRLWVVDSGILYVYSADIPYPNTKVLLEKQYDAMAVIEPSSYWVTVGEDVELNYVWKRPVETFVKHRVWMQKPDGVKKSIEGGLEVTYHNDASSWIFGEPIERMIRPSDIMTLDQRGDYLFTLEALHGDGNTSVDQRIVSVLYKVPLAQFNLTGLGIGFRVVGVDFDCEHKLWVLDEMGYWHQINRHYDRMIIDFRRKIIYFREPYEQVRVF